MPRIILDIQAIDESSKQLRVLDSSGNELLDLETSNPLARTIRLPGGGGPDDPRWSFPLPPVDELNNLPTFLFTDPGSLTIEEEAIRLAYQKILDRDTGSREVELFGQYLFITLLGHHLWQQIKAHIKDLNEPIELAIQSAEANSVLSRYPWEMMHDGTDFLAFTPDLSLTRRCKVNYEIDAGQELEARLLFIIGTSLKDDVIRPGAEYISIVHDLARLRLSNQIQTRILVEATTEKIEAAIEEFCPTLVHVICHGRYDSEGVYLELHDPSNPSQIKKVYASNFRMLLQTSKNLPLPRILLLSACNTATAEELSRGGELGSSFAAELVEGGIPMVVGMGGRVADLACRLFARSFYKALLTNTNVAHAVAEGRRAAVRYGNYEPGSSIDWALPTLFLADSINEPRFVFSYEDWLADWQDASRHYSYGAYPAFCTRYEVYEKFQLLMAQDTVQMQLSSTGRPFQVLLCSSKPSEEGIYDSAPPKFGRSWQLRSLALKGIKEGHVICLVSSEFESNKEASTTLIDLLTLTASAMKRTRLIFGLAPRNASYLQQLLDMVASDSDDPPPDGWPQELVQGWGRGPGAEERMASALRLDLLNLLESARANAGLLDENRIRMRLLFLVDDIHKLSSKDADTFLRLFIGLSGLQVVSEDIRIVLTYDEIGEMDDKTTIQSIMSWLGSVSNVENVHLGNFKKDLEVRLAYQNWLYNWREDGKPNGKVKRILIAPETTRNRDDIDLIYQILGENVKGVPSYFNLIATNAAVSTLLKIYSKVGHMTETTDNVEWNLLIVGEDLP